MFISLLTGVIKPSGAQSILGDVGLLALRLWAGGVMGLYYGVNKIERLQQDPIQFADPLGLGPTMSLVSAMLTELVGGILVALGLFTRAALVSLIFTFLVIVFIVKFSDGFKALELGAMYLMMYATLLMTGPGRFSLDHLIFGRRQNALQEDEPTP